MPISVDFDRDTAILHPLGDGLYVPNHLTATVEDDPRCDVNARLEIEFGDDGRPECRSIAYWPREGGPPLSKARSISATLLRTLVKEAVFVFTGPLKMDKQGRPKWALLISPAYDYDAATARFESAYGRAVRMPRRGQRLSDEFLEEVARVYRANPKRPTLAVAEVLAAERYKYPKSRASARSCARRWVYEARKRDKLGETTARTKGEGDNKTNGEEKED